MYYICRGFVDELYVGLVWGWCLVFMYQKTRLFGDHMDFVSPDPVFLGDFFLGISVGFPAAQNPFAG